MMASMSGKFPKFLSLRLGQTHSKSASMVPRYDIFSETNRNLGTLDLVVGCPGPKPNLYTLASSQALCPNEEQHSSLMSLFSVVCFWDWHLPRLSQGLIRGSQITLKHWSRPRVDPCMTDCALLLSG